MQRVDEMTTLELLQATKEELEILYEKAPVRMALIRVEAVLDLAIIAAKREAYVDPMDNIPCPSCGCTQRDGEEHTCAHCFTDVREGAR